MKCLKDTEFFLFSLWHTIFGIIYIVAQVFLYVFITHLFEVRYHTYIFLTQFFRSLEIIGYGAIAIVMLIRAGRTGGMEKAGALFLAVWLCMIGMVSFQQSMEYFIIHTIIGVVAGALLIIESRGRNVNETIGRYLLGFWLIAHPLAQYLALGYLNVFSGRMVCVVEMRAALGIMALVSGVFLLISKASSTASKTA